MKHKHSSEIFCPISEGFVLADNGASFLHQRVSSNTDQ